MAYIESHQEIGRHPKTKKMARSLGVSIPTAVGHLHLLWHWAMDFAQEGDLSTYEDADIADAALWEGDASAFIAALCDAGYLDLIETGLVIHDWFDYAGKLIERREANAQRMREARAAKEKPRAKHVQRTSPARAGATVPNPTVTEQTEPERTPLPPTGDAATPRKSTNAATPRDPLWDALIAGIGANPATVSERGAWNKAAKELRDVGAVAEEITVRCARYRLKWPEIDLTPVALAKHWGSLAHDGPVRTGNGHQPRSFTAIKLDETKDGLAEWNAQMDEEEHGTAHLQSANGAAEHRFRPGTDAPIPLNVLGPGEEPPRRPLHENGRSPH